MFEKSILTKIMRYREGIRLPILVGSGVFILMAMISAQAQEGILPLSTEVIQQRTGIQWKRISKEKAGASEIVRVLSRPYPIGPDVLEAKARTETATQIGESEAEHLALEFVLQNSALLTSQDIMGKIDPNQLSIVEVIANTYSAEYSERGTDYTVVIKQLYHGIPVFESECRVSLTREGEIWNVRNRLSVIDNPPTEPVLQADGALQAVRQAFDDNKAAPYENVSLFIYPPSRLVWHFNFLQPHFREVLVDAITGDIVLLRKNVQDAPPFRESAAMGSLLSQDAPQRGTYSSVNSRERKRLSAVGSANLQAEIEADKNRYESDCVTQPRNLHRNGSAGESAAESLSAVTLPEVEEEEDAE